MSSIFSSLQVSSSIQTGSIDIFEKILKFYNILNLPVPSIPHLSLQLLSNKLFENVNGIKECTILGILIRKNSIIFSSLENSRQRKIIRGLLNVIKKGEEGVTCLKAIYLLIIFLKEDEDLKGKVFGRKNIHMTCDLCSRVLTESEDSGIRFLAGEVFRDCCRYFKDDVETWDGFKSYLIETWKTVLADLYGDAESALKCLIEVMKSCGRSIGDKVLCILIERSSRTGSEGSNLVVNKLLKIINEAEFSYSNILGLTLLKYVLLMRSDKDEIVNATKMSVWRSLEISSNVKVLKEILERLRNLKHGEQELEGNTFMDLLSLISSSQSLCNLVLGFEGMKDGGGKIAEWCKSIEVRYYLKIERKKEKVRRIVRESVSPEREDEFEFKFSTPKSSLKMNLDERLKENETPLLTAQEEKENDDEAVYVGVGGVDGGVSVKVAVNLKICCGIFLARMCFNNTTRGEDVLRRRRDTVVSVAGEYFGVGRVRELVAFGLKQGFDKQMTQNCLVLTTLMMRVGGFGGGGLTESLYEGCRGEGERERKIKEERVKMDEEAREAREELAKLRRELNAVKYEVQQREIGWEKDLAKAKADAAQGASELASYHKAGREEAEKSLDEKNSELEECKVLNEDLKKR